MPLAKILFPFLHPKINPLDILPNRKLLSNHAIEGIKAILKDEPDGRYRKLVFPPSGKARYGIIKWNGHHYAVYKGQTANAHVATNERGTSKVKLVQELDSGKWFILKVLRQPDLTKASAEFHKLKKLNMLGEEHIFVRSSKKHEQKLSFIIKQKPGVDLINYLTAKHNLELSPLRRVNIALQVLLNIRHHHEQGYLLCDLKPENFIYDEQRNRANFVDIASLCEFDGKQRVVRSKIDATPNYLAPELINTYRFNHNIRTQNQSRNKKVDYVYTKQTDMYSAGTTLKVILNIPFAEVRSLQAAPVTAVPVLYRLGSSRHFHTDNSILTDTSETKLCGKISKFIDKMTATIPGTRPTLDQAISFFEKYRKKLLKHSRHTVGIMYLEDFMCALHKWKNDVDYLNNFFASFLQVDEIQFVSRYDLYTVNPMTNHVLRYSDLIRVRKVLIDKIAFGREIFICPDSNTLAQLPGQLQSGEPDNVKKTYILYDLTKYTVAALRRINRGASSRSASPLDSKSEASPDSNTTRVNSTYYHTVHSKSSIAEKSEAKSTSPASLASLHMPLPLDPVPDEATKAKMVPVVSNGTDHPAIAPQPNGYHISGVSKPHMNGSAYAGKDHQFSNSHSGEANEHKLTNGLARPALLSSLQRASTASPTSSPPSTGPLSTQNISVLLRTGMNVIKIDTVKEQSTYRSEVSECKTLVERVDFNKIQRVLKTERNRLDRKYKLTYAPNSSAETTLRQQYNANRHHTLISALKNLRFLNKHDQLSYALTLSLLDDFNKGWHKDAPPPGFFRKLFGIKRHSPFEDLRKTLETARIKIK
jgi:serine/threonine protein kinase